MTANDGSVTEAWVEPGKQLDVPLDCKAGSKISIEFEVFSTGWIANRVLGYLDFDVMLQREGTDDAIRLYGPSRRIQRASAVVAVPEDGTLHFLWDNSTAWTAKKLVRYKLTQASAAGEEGGSAPPAQQPTGGDADVASLELNIAAGSAEEVSIPVVEGGTLALRFEVASGTDIDFGVMLVPSDGSGPIRLYGPSRRALSLDTTVSCPVDGVAHAGFDASSSWFRSKRVRYAFDCKTEV